MSYYLSSGLKHALIISVSATAIIADFSVLAGMEALLAAEIVVDNVFRESVGTGLSLLAAWSSEASLEAEFTFSGGGVMEILENLALDAINGGGNLSNVGDVGPAINEGPFILEFLSLTFGGRGGGLSEGELL